MSKYVEDWNIYPDFQEDEFKCPHCGSVGNGIASNLLDLAQHLRNKYGCMVITSGYRCQEYNDSLVGSSPTSKHLEGRAMDFYFTSGILNDQNRRIEMCDEIRQYPNVEYVYCNINGNHPNMGSVIHAQVRFSEDATKQTFTKHLQIALNTDFNSNLVVDGSYGPATKKAVNDNYLKYYTKGEFVKWLQARLGEQGYDLTLDGSYGPYTDRNVRLYQSANNLTSDGMVGSNTVESILNKY